MKVANKFYKLSGKLVDLVYPWTCEMCGVNTNNKSICDQCELYLPWCYADRRCDVCGLPITGGTSHILICGQCQKQAPHFDHLSAAFWYQPPINHFITQYKYLNRWENVRTLTELSKQSLKSSSKNRIVIPVPSHDSRIRQRGFNAVNELVKVLKKGCQFEYQDKLVKRIKNTQSQTGKTKAQRRKNVSNAFEINQFINAEHVLIIDEVVTTGATVNELSRCLKQAGVRKVSVWAMARTRVIGRA